MIAISYLLFYALQTECEEQKVSVSGDSRSWRKVLLQEGDVAQKNAFVRLYGYSILAKSCSWQEPCSQTEKQTFKYLISSQWLSSKINLNSLTVWLCHQLHQLQHSNNGRWFALLIMYLLENILCSSWQAVLVPKLLGCASTRDWSCQESSDSAKTLRHKSSVCGGFFFFFFYATNYRCGTNVSAGLRSLTIAEVITNQWPSGVDVIPVWMAVQWLILPLYCT